MRLTYEDEYGTYTIEKKDDENVSVGIYGVVNDLIIPMLRAAGYSESTIDNLWKNNEY